MDTSIVESYRLYEWTQALSSRQKTSTKNFVEWKTASHQVDRGPSNQLSSRTSRSSGPDKHCRVIRVVRVDTSIVESTMNFVKCKNASH